MNKKSFFRGFGVGVLFVTVVLGISCLMHTSDSAVISRAKKLGMTFADSDNKIVYATAENVSGSAVSDNNNAISDKDNDKQDDKKDVRNTPAPSPVVSKKKKKDRSFEKEKKKMQKSLNESIQKENDRVPMKLDNVYIIKHVEIPLSIVECGFLSNPEEEQLLLEDDYQNRLAWGIYNGIINYFYK